MKNLIALVLMCLSLSGGLLTEETVVPASIRKPFFGLTFDHGGSQPGESKIVVWSEQQRPGGWVVGVAGRAR